MIRRALIFVMVLAAGSLFWSCSDQTPTSPQGASITIATSLSGLEMAGSVARVTLEVSGSDFATITRDLTFADGEASTVLEIPFGANRRFLMTAYDAEDVVLYRGETSVDIIAGAPTVVDILLEPQVRMMRMTPLFQQTAIGDFDTLSVIINDIDSLFGVAFRLVYDTSIIGISSVSAGGFLDPSALLFSYMDSNYVAITHVLKGTQEPQGVSGSGTLIEIVYTGKAAGRTQLLLQNAQGGAADELIDWQGERLPRSGTLYIENAEVEVIEP